MLQTLPIDEGGNRYSPFYEWNDNILATQV